MLLHYDFFFTRKQWQRRSAERKCLDAKGFRIRYRLHPSALRQRKLNKTAINKDKVRIRTLDSFNQIRNIKVPSKAKEQDERTKRWMRGGLARGWRSTFHEGWQPGISLYLQNPSLRDKELPSVAAPHSRFPHVLPPFESPALFVIFLGSCIRDSFCFLILRLA